MGQFDNLSEAEITTLINELQESRRKKQGRITKSLLHSMLDPNSTDFMGSGMTWQEYLIVGELERIKSAYWRQTREEKTRRRNISVALAVEYAKILQQTLHATAFAQEAIVAVINGDWHEMGSCRDMLTFDGERMSHKETYAPIFARFVEILDEALAGVPQPEAGEKQLEPTH